MKPLAYSMRPTHYDYIVGQDHLVGPNGILRKMLNNNHLFSFILYGEPGCGKTTIAEATCAMSKIPCHRFNASTDNKEALKINFVLVDIPSAFKKYEYEDDLYVIRLPKDSSEIITEGSKQSICIGGYTTRHANGETNLFFLREKSNPDKPFYAIEMNRNIIIQIHGFGNKWLGNNPEAIPTVIRWLRKNGISCSNEILTCTARGYGKVNEYIEMPVVD